MSIGEFDYPFHEDRFINDWACAFFAVFVVLVHLLYLNVLIAMMASSYKAVSEDARASASFNRAALLLRYEATISDDDREKYHNKVRPQRGRREHFSLPDETRGVVRDLFFEHDLALLIAPAKYEAEEAEEDARGAEQMRRIEDGVAALLQRMETLEAKLVA
mmetsp:Transcript_20384/g.61928  ORF Transcript_20384/g.61928 Transcript_20384/m.61928 type:complete len:162 (+) Transcript_20384:145-630(+)